MNAIESVLPQMKRIRGFALVLGTAALAACIIGAFFQPRQFFHSYLIGYMFWLGTALGAFGFVMINHLTGGYWGVITRRPFEAAFSTLPLMAVYTIPLLIALPQLYEWTRPAAVAGDPRLQAKAFYLNLPLFYSREVIYFAIWLAFAWFLRKWSAEQDRTGDPAVLTRLRYLSGPGLVLYGSTITFAAIDWIMALEPHFYSTTFGFQFMTSQALNAMSFGVVVAMLLSGAEPIAGLLNPKRLRDLGNLTLACLMLWAYITFEEYLIIWSGNIPDETSWFRHRFWAGWGRLIWLLVAFHFFIPFLLLIQRAVKHRPRVLMGVAAWLLFMRLVYLFWMIEPAEHPTFLVHWMDVLAPIGLGGIWVAVFVWQLGKQPLVPVHDPLLQEEFASGRKAVA